MKIVKDLFLHLAIFLIYAIIPYLVSIETKQSHEFLLYFVIVVGCLILHNLINLFLLIRKKDLVLNYRFFFVLFLSLYWFNIAIK